MLPGSSVHALRENYALSEGKLKLGKASWTRAAGCAERRRRPCVARTHGKWLDQMPEPRPPAENRNSLACKTSSLHSSTHRSLTAAQDKKWSRGRAGCRRVDYSSIDWLPSLNQLHGKGLFPSSHQRWRKNLNLSTGTRDNSTVEAEQFAKFITVNGVNYLLFSTVFVRKGLGRILLMTSLS